MQISNRLKRLRNRYKLIILNEDTYEEVVKFKLTRLSVYIAMSTLFILLISLTTALIIFTPLKHYLPGVGYANSKQIKEFRDLKRRADSIDLSLKNNIQYINDIEKVLKGKIPILDTTKLNLPKPENIDE